MKERPILFSAPMVRAILAGTKTQTRRVVKPQPSRELLAEYASIRAARGSARTDTQMLSDCLPCPFGQPGDRLWVREAWLHIDDEGDKFDGMGSQTYYRASSMNPERDEAYMRQRGLCWRPSIHMPRWASRITLEVTGVRVEPLQDISDADAHAEGAEPRQPATASGMCIPGQHRLGFRDLWQQINGSGSWDANPWVWVIEFKRMEGQS